MPFDLSAQDERRPSRVVDDAFEPAAVAAELAGHAPPVCALNDALPPGARSPSLAVFAFGAAPCAYARARFQLGHLAGAVLLPEVDVSGSALEPSVRDRSCDIYRLPLEPPYDALVLVCQYPIRSERAHAWAECVLRAISPARALVLDEQPWHPALPERAGPGPCIRALETTAHKAARAAGGAPPAAPELEPLGMIGGAPAELLSRCEAAGVPALLLFVAQTVEDSLYDDMLGLEAALGGYASGAGKAAGASGALGALLRPAGAEEAREALYAMAASLNASGAEPSSGMFA